MVWRGSRDVGPTRTCVSAPPPLAIQGCIEPFYIRRTIFILRHLFRLSHILLLIHYYSDIDTATAFVRVL